MQTRPLFPFLILFLAAACSALVAAAADKKPLTNADVIKMVKAGLPESTILLAIQASPRDFDSSADALIQLQSNGVSAGIMEAMLTAGSASPPSSVTPELPAPAPTATTVAPPSAGAALPQAFAVDETGTRTELASTTFKIVETKAKGASVAAIVTESAVTEVADEVVRAGTSEAIAATGGRFGATIGKAASWTSSLGRKLFRTDEVTLTYVYALDGPESTQTVPAGAVRFEIDFSDLNGANPDEFQPAILKVSPTPQSWRMVGAMKAKKSEFNDATPRELNFIEDQVECSVKRQSRGRAEITLPAALPSGEYAIVLRPVDAGRKFSLQQFEQEQGDGRVLRLLWDFRVPPLP